MDCARPAENHCRCASASSQAGARASCQYVRATRFIRRSADEICAPQEKNGWQVPDKRPLADFVPTTILTAKKLAAELAIVNTKDRQMERAIANEHLESNIAVRNSFLERGIQPETLAPAEDVKEEGRAAAEVSSEKVAEKSRDSGLVQDGGRKAVIQEIKGLPW